MQCSMKNERMTNTHSQFRYATHRQLPADAFKAVDVTDGSCAFSRTQGHPPPSSHTVIGAHKYLSLHNYLVSVVEQILCYLISSSTRRATRDKTYMLNSAAGYWIFHPRTRRYDRRCNHSVNTHANAHVVDQYRHSICDNRLPITHTTIRRPRGTFEGLLIEKKKLACGSGKNDWGIQAHV